LIREESLRTLGRATLATDTYRCCIDKTSSAELSEAINSMFRWYQKASVCYAYLADVLKDTDPDKDPEEFSRSRWFTRGWTLQELVAPKNVVFYSRSWKNIGTKERLCNTISTITGIDIDTLLGEDVTFVSVANKMSWASGRRTTRTEDMAYCLLGIFDVNMPLLYGEGKKAFLRLQEEILRSSYDHSLFAWGRGTASISDIEKQIQPQAINMNGLYSKVASGSSVSSSKDPAEESLLQGLLAGSPTEFRKSRDVESVDFLGEIDGTPPIIHNRCVHIDLPVVSTVEDENLSIVVLGCRFRHDSSNYLGVALRRWGSGVYSGRLQALILVPSKYVEIDKSGVIRNGTERMRIKAESREEIIEGCFMIKQLPLTSSGYKLGKVHCLSGAHFNRRSRVFQPKATVDGAQAIFIFYNVHGNQFAILLAKVSGPSGHRRKSLHDVLSQEEDLSPVSSSRGKLYIKKLSTREQQMTEERLERILKDGPKDSEHWIADDGTKVSLELKDGVQIMGECIGQNVFITAHFQLGAGVDTWMPEKENDNK